jgi:hypothetical protein
VPGMFELVLAHKVVKVSYAPRSRHQTDVHGAALAVHLAGHSVGHADLVALYFSFCSYEMCENMCVACRCTLQLHVLGHTDTYSNFENITTKFGMRHGFPHTQ